MKGKRKSFLFERPKSQPSSFIFYPLTQSGTRFAHSTGETREIPRDKLSNIMATTITFKGEPVELSGNPPQVGDQAPAFDLVNTKMESVKLSDSDGKIRVISIIPSIDTGVCEAQTRRFNKALDEMPDNVVGITISEDTPFAQSRWCGAEGVSKMEMLSDFKGNTFGQDYGLYMPSMGLLARSVYIIDGDGKVQYFQLVPEMSEEPNYDEVLDKVKELAS